MKMLLVLGATGTRGLNTDRIFHSLFLPFRFFPQICFMFLFFLYGETFFFPMGQGTSSWKPPKDWWDLSLCGVYYWRSSNPWHWIQVKMSMQEIWLAALESGVYFWANRLWVCTGLHLQSAPILWIQKMEMLNSWRLGCWGGNAVSVCHVRGSGFKFVVSLITEKI